MDGDKLEKGTSGGTSADGATVGPVSAELGSSGSDELGGLGCAALVGAE
jgi:hypothetical protein